MVHAATSAWTEAACPISGRRLFSDGTMERALFRQSDRKCDGETKARIKPGRISIRLDGRGLSLWGSCAGGSDGRRVQVPARAVQPSRARAVGSRETVSSLRSGRMSFALRALGGPETSRTVRQSRPVVP